MVTIIEVLSGPQRGLQFKASPDVTLGRTQAKVVIDDPKISSIHAEFVLNEKGKLVLVDLDSANGLHLNGRRIKKVTLLLGVTFRVGDTEFKVVDIRHDIAPDAPPAKTATWREVVRQSLNDLISDYPIKTKQVHFVEKILQLKFTHGLKAGDEYLISYLPRKAGFGNLDLDIKDLNLPKDSFELTKDSGMVRIQIFTPEHIKLNSLAIANKVLEDGDTLSFGSSIIKVKYLED